MVNAMTENSSPAGYAPVFLSFCQSVDACEDPRMESNDALAYRLDAYKKIVQFVRDGVAHECIADVHEVAVLLPTIYPVLLKDTKSQDPALAIYAHRILGFCCLHPAFRQLAPVPLVLTTWCEGLVKKDTDKDGILLAVLWSVQNHNLPLAASDNQRLQDAVSSLLTAPSAVFSTSLKVCAVAALNKLIQQSRPSDSADCKWIPDVVSFLFATDPKLRDASCDLLDLVPSTVQYSQNVLRVLSAKASMSLGNEAHHNAWIVYCRSLTFSPHLCDI